MGLKKITLRLWHPECWSIESTKDHPGICLITKGVFKLENEVRANFHLIAESYDDLKSYISDIEKYDRYAREVYVIGKSDLEADIHARFPSHATFYDRIFSLEFMPMRISISSGYEYWTVLIDEERLRDTLNRLLDVDGVDVEILSITNLKSFEDGEGEDIIEQISRTLSMKQKKVLVEAYRSGYFEWPRKTSVDELAKSFGIAKSTCLHHLRVAESKVMKRFIEELRDREPHLMDLNSTSRHLF